MQEGVPYRKGFYVLMLRCVAHDVAKRVLKEVHEGACDDYTRRQTLTEKILGYRYFWPTANRDAAYYTRKCYKC